jgi:hypothetical protein
MAIHQPVKPEDLPPDNAARLAIYDALFSRKEATGVAEVASDELFEQVIGRLRVLVPRELHVMGERAYVHDKIRSCIEAGIISTNSDNGRWLLTLSGKPPQVRYPDGEIQDYSPGLELARERLDRDNARMRSEGFDVRKFLPSISDKPGGEQFQTLLSSMREHGFLKQFPVVKYEDGIFVDGRARVKAAAILHLDVEYLRYASDKDKKAARRSDTPLNRVLVAVSSNACRLSTDAFDLVYERVAAATSRSWNETAADLDLTRAWRRSIPLEYPAVFNVEKHAYRAGDQPKIQVTSDGKVMLRSLVEAAGLAAYKIQTQNLEDHVPVERARTQYSGRKADFARINDLIVGIAAMQQARQAQKLKLDPEWDQIVAWLISSFGPAPG